MPGMFVSNSPQFGSLFYQVSGRKMPPAAQSHGCGSKAVPVKVQYHIAEN